MIDKNDFRALMRLIAICLTKDTEDAESALKWAYDGQEKAVRSAKSVKVHSIDEDAVQRIYDLYPSSTVRSDGKKSSLRSADYDKKEIRKLLANKTEEELTMAIKRYLQETEPQYLKMLGTLLHHLPDYNENTPSNKPQRETNQVVEPTNNSLFDDPQMMAILEERRKFYQSNP